MGRSLTLRVSSRIFQRGGGGGGAASVPLCSHPRIHEVGGGGGGCASTDLIGPVGSGGLPIMHCAPNILSKIGIEVRNSRLCDLLQGRVQDFATGGGGG